MESKDVGAAWGELARARREGSTEARSFGAMALDSRMHVGDGESFFCHVMESVVPGKWELWRLATPQANAVFALRAGAVPAQWFEAGTISLDSPFAAFIPEAAAAEIQALEDEELPCHFAPELIDPLTTGARDEAVLKTPGGAPLAAFRLGGPGRYDVSKGLDGRGQVCVLGIVS